MKNRLNHINFYIEVAENGINIAQGAINYPIKKNFLTALESYENWLVSMCDYIRDFDKKAANLLFKSPDGVSTHLNLFEGRASNTEPVNYSFFKYKNDKNIYVDEAGVKTLENIILSFKQKMQILRELKLKVTGGVVSKKGSKKVTIMFYLSGDIETNINRKSMKIGKSSVIMRLIKNIRDVDDLKLAYLASKLKVEKTNLSRDVKVFNKKIASELGLREPVILGYSMNKKVYNFSYEDL